MKKASIGIVLLVALSAVFLRCTPASNSPQTVAVDRLEWESAGGTLLLFSFLVFMGTNAACCAYIDKSATTDGAIPGFPPMRMLTQEGFVFAKIRFFAVITGALSALVAILASL